MSNNENATGWGWPALSKKAHFFRDGLTQLEWLAAMSVVVDELCRRALEGKP